LRLLRVSTVSNRGGGYVIGSIEVFGCPGIETTVPVNEENVEGDCMLSAHMDYKTPLDPLNLK
jgi:hypothetical protein